jgi:hypothetical protein
MERLLLWRSGMTLLKRLIPMVLAVLLSGCIELPEVAEPEPPPDGGPGNSPAGFTLTISPAQIAIPQGGNHIFQVSLTRKNGFDGDVLIDLWNSPSGITTQPITLLSGSTSANLIISVGENVALGTKSLVLRGTSGSLSAEAPVEVTVLQPGELLVRWGTPTQAKIFVNGVLPLAVSVEGGTADSLEFLKGSVLLARLVTPPYQFNWDTTQEAEGTYEIVARATRRSSTFSSTTLTVVVDRTAPSVLSRTPQPGAASVSVRDGIQVVFSESMRPSSVTSSSIVLSTGTTSNTEKNLSLTPDGTSLTIQPTSPLPVPSTVTISLGTTTEPVTDLAGNPLTPPGDWIFTLPVWLPLGGPISAVPGSTSAENVTMKIDLSGKPVIAWAESDGSSKNIYVRRWNGVDWEALGGALSAIGGTNTPADHPALVVDGLNRPIVIWDEATTTSSTSTINLYARRWIGDTWESLPDFPAPGTENQRFNPTAAIDGANNLYVFSVFYPQAYTELHGFILNPGATSWVSQNPYRPSSQANPGHPSMATYGSTTFFLAYDVFADSPGARGISVYQGFSNQLGNLLPITTPGGVANFPSVSVDGAGNPWVAWQEGPNTATSETIHAAKWNGSWQLLGAQVSTASSSNSTPSLVIGSDGYPTVAWSGYVAPERVILVSRWTGQEWATLGTSLNAAVGVNTPGFKPTLATGSNNQLTIAWHETDGSTSNVYAYRFNN